MRVFLGLLIIAANCGVLTTGALAQEKAAVRKTETIQENLAGKEESDVTAPHADLSYYLNESGSKQKIATRDEWEKRRQEIRRSVELVMGVLPDRKDLPPLEVEVLEEYRSEKWIRRKVRYCSDASSKITAYLFLPLHSPLATSSQTSKESEAATTARHPAILALHQTTGIGKSEPAGLGGNPNLQYALHLAERGFVTLAPDYPSFGEYEYDFQNGAYSSGSMKGIYDNMRSVDFLQSLPEVDSQRIGCIGHSLGGHNAIFTSFFDERISAVVSSCGFTRFHKYYQGNLKGWTSDRYMPRIETEYRSDPNLVPFDFPELIASLAPRSFMASAPTRDDNFEVSGVVDSIAEASKIYGLYGAGDRIRAIYPEASHDFPEEARESAYRFLTEALTR